MKISLKRMRSSQAPLYVDSETHQLNCLFVVRQMIHRRQKIDDLIPHVEREWGMATQAAGRHCSREHLGKIEHSAKL